MNRITVMLVEDHTIVLEGMRGLLEAGGHIQVIAEAQNGRQAVEHAKKFSPSVIIMDIAMPGLNGLEAARQILAVRPEAKIIIMSAHDDDAYVDKAIEIGAAGYLLKQSSASVLATAIRDVMGGKLALSPVLRKRLEDRNERAPNRAGQLKTKTVQLSKRETETLQLIAEGRANKQIAAELGISIKTVEKHRQQLMNKLDIHDTASLTRFAIATGVIEVGVKVSII